MRGIAPVTELARRQPAGYTSTRLKCGMVYLDIRRDVGIFIKLCSLEIKYHRKLAKLLFTTRIRWITRSDNHYSTFL
ncbi:MAG: hypothetical protein NTW69_11330, partial [Chloroflexi bacterium]|nr:hypothetical protein [Chloroflexota bacterium]